MSIIVSVKVRDGIVLATDSMSQIYMKDEQGRVGVGQTYSNARKLFQISKLHMAVMAYGAGNIGKGSVQGILEDFSDIVRRAKPEEINTVEKVTKKLRAYLGEFYESELGDIVDAEKPLVGIFIGGYSRGHPDEWEFVLPTQPDVRRVRPRDVYGASWRGVALPFTRLHFGIDPRIREDLTKLGVNVDTIEKACRPFKAQVAYDAMPVQDAVNYAYHMLRTTIDHTTYEIGPPACGGPVDIAVITKVDGFQWVNQRKLTVQGV